jgi:hypothetical protein
LRSPIAIVLRLSGEPEIRPAIVERVTIHMVNVGIAGDESEDEPVHEPIPPPSVDTHARLCIDGVQAALC